MLITFSVGDVHFYTCCYRQQRDYDKTKLIKQNWTGHSDMSDVQATKRIVVSASTVLVWCA